MDIVIPALLTGIGLVILCYGGTWLVNGGVAIAKRLGISNIVIGMTIVAYGTSTPELAAAIAASGEHSRLVLGNVIGSNIANIGMVIGVASILIPIVIDKKIIRREIPVMIGTSLLVIVLSLDGEISRFDGILLVGMLAAFAIYMYRKEVRTPQPRQDSLPQNKNIYFRSFILLSAGIAMLYFGADLTVDNAVLIAHALNVPERIIGITVIAIGTSLPELITSVIAIRKGHSDLGIGNIIGSNIYNILMILGISATIAGIPIVMGVYFDYAIMLLFALSLFVLLVPKMVGKKIGIVLVISYGIYLGSSFFFGL